VEIKLSIEDSLRGFNKILDFQDLSPDVGPYALGGAIDFFTIGPAAGSLALNTDFIVGLARSEETVSEAQLGLFNEAEALAGEDDSQDTENSALTVAPYRRGTPKRQPLPELGASRD
jgi:hypothetical protein